jgi:hypothetical protein
MPTKQFKLEAISIKKVIKTYPDYNICGENCVIKIERRNVYDVKNGTLITQI